MDNSYRTLVSKTLRRPTSEWGLHSGEVVSFLPSMRQCVFHPGVLLWL